MHYYIFHLDGTIEKVIPPHPLSLDELNDQVVTLNSKYPSLHSDLKETYMLALPDKEESLYLIMHINNDFDQEIETSPLPINLTLRQWYPISPYRGEMLIVKLDSKDFLSTDSWDYEVLKEWEMYYHSQKILGKTYHSYLILGND